MIHVETAVKTYGSVRVVDGVDLRFPPAQLTSVIGPNGAGKSTLLSLVARLLTPDSGLVTLDGTDVHTARSDELARRLAILRQDNHTTARLSVHDLVSFGRYPYSRGRPTREDREHVDRALEFLDLTALGDRYLDELSGGQRQRAFVAMVLCQDTDYLLLDEPLNNLDPKHALAMMRLVCRARDELGKSVVVVLHDVNAAARYSDRIVAMRDGTVLYEGAVDDVIRPEVLSKVYDVDVQVHHLAGHRVVTYHH